MSIRKPLYLSNSGFPEEMSGLDGLVLGELTMSGVIAMNNNSITGLANGNTGSQDAATVNQVEALISASISSGFVENTFPVNETINIGDPVYITSTANRVGRALSSDETKSWIIGVAITSQSTPGSNVTTIGCGVAAGVLTGATPGTRYYLQPTGGIGTTIPSSGNRIILCGVAINTTDLYVRISDFGKKAP